MRQVVATNGMHEAKAGSRVGGYAARRTRNLWIVLQGEFPLPYGVVLPGGGEALALFSGEEEARIFCTLGEADGVRRRIRRASVGEVVSLLDGPTFGCVALDPFPEILNDGPIGAGLLGLLTLDRERFVRRFGSSLGSEPVDGPPDGDVSEVSLPEGYSLEHDPDALLLVSDDGRLVGVFSVRGPRGRPSRKPPGGPRKKRGHLRIYHPSRPRPCDHQALGDRSKGLLSVIVWSLF